MADVTRVLSSQTRTTALASQVPRVLKLPQLAIELAQIRQFSDGGSLTVHLALPPPTSGSRGYDVLYVAIHRLNDDILLDIFNYFRLDEENGWNDRLGWCKLSHVCQRWRHLIYDSTFHLGMHIHCTHGTPTVDTLDHLPPLPLLVDYRHTGVTIQKKDEIGMHHALRLRDRVRQIDLNLPPSILPRCLVLMDEHFPILEHLSLSFPGNKFTTLTLPKAFLAPNLRYLALPAISPPKRLRLFTSTVLLVTLVLQNIQTSSYFRPRLLVSRLSSLPQLEELSIGFSIPILRPSTERELLGELGTPVTLPNLKIFKFQGVGAYLESFVAQIRVPLLNRIDITLFNQIAFALPHLSHLINITEGLKLPTVMISFNPDDISITTAEHCLPWSDRPFRLRVMCKQLDWQIDCAAQICSMLIPEPSDVERFKLDFYGTTLPNELRDGGIDCTTWHELFSSFIGVEELHLCPGLLEELSQALQADEVGSNSGFLPNLQNIICVASGNNLFASFIDARRVLTGRRIQFLSPLAWRRRITTRLARSWAAGGNNHT